MLEIIRTLPDKQDMPHIRQYAPGDPIIAEHPIPPNRLPPIQQPLPQGNILLARMPPDTLARHHELRTTLRAQRIRAPHLRNLVLLIASKYRRQRTRQRLVRRNPRTPRLQHRLEIILQTALRRRRRQTHARAPVAAHIMIPGWFQRSLHVQRRQQRGVVVLGVVVVPGEARAVHEHRPARRDVLVVVDQEGEVGHCLVAAVRGDLEVFRGWVGGRIDGVDAEVVALREGVEPGGVAVGGNAGDDQGGFGGFFEAGTDAARFGDFAGGLVADASPGEGLVRGWGAVEEDQEEYDAPEDH